MITGSSFALLILLLITAACLWVRGHRSRAFGANVDPIILGTLGCVVYLSLLIAQVTAGCLGKEIYHCTYQELQCFYEVCYVFAHCMYLSPNVFEASTILLPPLLLHRLLR